MSRNNSEVGQRKHLQREAKLKGRPQFRGIKSNFDATRHEERMSQIREARLAEEAKIKALVEANQAKTPQKESSPFNLRVPALAEAPVFNYEPGEFGPEDPRGIQAMVKTFYDDAAAAREAVYAYYEQHKGTELTAEMIAVYDSLYEDAEYALEKVSAIRKITDLVSSAFTQEFVAAQSAEAKQRLYDALTGIDPKEIAALIAQDFRSVGGVIKRLYNLRNVDRRQFGMAVKVVGVLLFGTIVPLSQAACSVATEPGVTPTTTETTGTQEGVTVAAPTEPAPTEPAPTDPAPEPTPTAEAEATLIPNDVLFDSDIPENTELRNQYYTFFKDSDIFTPGNPNALVTESSVMIHSDRIAELIGDPSKYEGAGYGPGDFVVLDENHQYDGIYGHLVFDGENQIDLSADETYSLQFDQDGTLFWGSSDPTKEKYYWDQNFSDGEFIPMQFIEELAMQLQEEIDLDEAKALNENVAYLEYDVDGKTIAYDAEGNPVLQKANESLVWEVVEKEVVFNQWQPEKLTPVSNEFMLGGALEITSPELMNKAYEDIVMGLILSPANEEYRQALGISATADYAAAKAQLTRTVTNPTTGATEEKVFLPLEAGGKQLEIPYNDGWQNFKWAPLSSYIKDSELKKKLTETGIDLTNGMGLVTHGWDEWQDEESAVKEYIEGLDGPNKMIQFPNLYSYGLKVNSEGQLIFIASSRTPYDSTGLIYWKSLIMGSDLTVQQNAALANGLLTSYVEMLKRMRTHEDVVYSHRQPVCIVPFGDPQDCRATPTGVMGQPDETGQVSTEVPIVPFFRPKLQ